MRLKIYELRDPRTDKVEMVFAYPTSLASSVVFRNNATLVSREPLRIPILVVPNDYLTELTNLRESTEFMYAQLDLYDHWVALKEKQQDQAKYNSKLAQLKTIFGDGITRTYNFKTTFFTGPKSVYKRTFTDAWMNLSADRYGLLNVGLFRTIDDLSIKGINELFLTGTFECGDEVVENTQCKVTFTNQ